MIARLMRNTLVRRLIRRRIAKRILACFDGVDLTQHTFESGHGRFIRTTAGEDRFYSASQIDVAIKRVNELLSELRS